VWSLYSPERKQVLWQSKIVKKRENKDGTISKVPDVYYRCATCGDEFKQGEVQVDHREPVGKTPDFPPKADETAWVEWILRVFCGVENLQVICKSCHRAKSLEDNRKTRWNK
jgi:5-methylcytosine-specific restriction endonuclease McrA